MSVSLKSVLKPSDSSGAKRPAALQRRELPPPITVFKFLDMAVIIACRKYLFVKVQIKILFYALLILVGSLFTDFYPLPRSSLTAKSSFFNFVIKNAGLLLPVIVLAFFIYYVYNILNIGNKYVLKQQYARLIIMVVCWFLATKVIFDKVDRATGSCVIGAKSETIASKQECLMKSGRWMSFDVSGHTFLLMYCALVIMEEAVAFKYLFRLTDILNRARNDDTPELMTLNRDEVASLGRIYEEFNTKARISFIILAFLAFLWDLMLIITVVYYHSFPQKLAGGAFAVAFWWLTYRFWFKKEMSPGFPGCSRVRFLASERRS